MNARRKKIRKLLKLFMAGSLAAACIAPFGAAAAQEPAGDTTFEMVKIAAYDSEAGFEAGGTEIVAYDWEGKRAYSTNSKEKAIDILDLSKLGELDTIERIDRVTIEDFKIEHFTPDGITSVAVHPSGAYIAAAVPASPRTDNGKVVFMDLNGTPLNSVTVGALPDMLTFTPDGKLLLAANEGEPATDYSVDPEGSVSIIDVSRKMLSELTDSDVVTAGFGEVAIPEGVRVFAGLPEGKASSAAQHIEPEYIAVSADSKQAYVALQENNAIGVLDLTDLAFREVRALGVKDHSAAGSGMDVSDKDGAVDIKPVPLLGMYMPDGMAMVENGGKSYILTANEGDVREYDAYAEADRVNKLEGSIALDASHYEGFSQEELDSLLADGAFGADEKLGRIHVTKAGGWNAEQGKYDRLYSFGARSFSVWDAETGALAYDSGEDFERVTAEVYPDYFNVSNSNNEKDNRSDDKGPEPEYVEVGKAAGRTYAFIGLERTSGIMVYDVTNPVSPEYVTFVSSRDFAGDVEQNQAGDVAPEGLDFVPADQSPTGKPLLLAAHEVSGTIAVYEITAVRTFADMQTHWAKGEVESLASKLIVNGVNEREFRPQAAVTRAEFTALIVRALGLDGAEAQAGAFDDVSAGKWYAGAIGTADEAGLVGGYEDGTFRPEARITRQEIAVIAMKAMKFAGGGAAGAGGEEAELPAFTDAASIAGWARAAVAEAVEEALLEGLPGGEFAPAAPATRAEAAALVHRLLKRVGLID